MRLNFEDVVYKRQALCDGFYGLTHCGLVTPYSDINLGSANGLLPEQAITWTNVDRSSKVFCGVNLRAIW